MARIGAIVLTSSLALLANASQAQPPPLLDARLVVDVDDDDLDGVADAEATAVTDDTDCAVFEIGALPAGLRLQTIDPPRAVRVLVDGKPLELGKAVPSRGHRLAVQALRPGRSRIDLTTVQIHARSVQLVALDGSGAEVSLARSHASLQRTIPDRGITPDAIARDPDALRYFVVGQREDLPATARVVSRSERGARLQEQVVSLVESRCPGGLEPGLVCRATRPIRVVGEVIDAEHPLVADRSVQGELGGGILIDLGMGRRQQLRVGGPRKTRLGPIGRLRATMRVRLVDLAPVGVTENGGLGRRVIGRAREQIALANALWGQCGISFGPPGEAEVAPMDLPPPFMIAVGCDLGTPSVGGDLHLLVDGRPLNIRLSAGSTPSQVARRLSTELELRGYKATESPNSQIAPGALPTVDVLVRHRDGTLARVQPRGVESTDRGLGVCTGPADMSAGLQHFFDVDSMAGTFAERLLLKAIDDHDPSTIDVLVIGAFARGGRIGESFIGVDGSSIRNAVIIDRAGLRVARASFTLAHEVGHVLLDVPGHPDDFGVDTPTQLMDSDNADLSAFGPRRLTVAECERVVQQSGPTAPVPLLRVWPWGRLPK